MERKKSRDEEDLLLCENDLKMKEVRTGWFGLMHKIKLEWSFLIKVWWLRKSFVLYICEKEEAEESKASVNILQYWPKIFYFTIST